MCSLACLGEVIIFSIKWHEKTRFLTGAIVAVVPDVIVLEATGIASGQDAVGAAGACSRPENRNDGRRVESLCINGRDANACRHVDVRQKLVISPLFSQLFLCLSRACLGKMIVFIYKLLQHTPCAPWMRPHGWLTFINL